ncbi:hypothetical protein ATCVNTS1_738L [Acanthocystis turfacea Chlorella virus NTS-1]|nr:hypothetical protein ATCVNTS1_738L [Acanthocystis turfacea Chlorella virus NTS-1]
MRCPCGKQPSFGLPGQAPTCCSGCKEPGMKDVVHTKCSCGKRPVFGLPGQKPTHCSKCRTFDMDNVNAKKCPCGKQASFGLPGKKPTCCVGCKTPVMEDVVSKKCSCGKTPSFGLPGEKPTCCAGCKEPGMKDVRSKKCPCGKIPSFGPPGEKPTCCAGCKERDMENVAHEKCPCGKQPSFGLPGEKPTCCVACKEDDMEDVRSKRCPGYNGNPCIVGYVLRYGFEYCHECDPDEARRVTKKRSEAAFFYFLKKSGVEVTQEQYWIEYRCIDTDKKRAEIDGVIITKDVVVCLELDEDAHESYPKLCEQTRMHNATAELMIAFPNHSIAWVRVNPHTKKDGKRDTTSHAKTIRNQRHKKALKIIKDILQNPRNCVEYIGY